MPGDDPSALRRGYRGDRTFESAGHLRRSDRRVAGPEPSAKERMRSWQATIRNAATYLQASSFVSCCHISVVGYSLGADLTVAVTSSLPEVRAALVLFGAGRLSF